MGGEEKAHAVQCTFYKLKYGVEGKVIHLVK